jgi:hypothetical protein
MSNPKTGRNDPCPCGSGKKYKRCCLLNEPPPAPTAETETPVAAEAAGDGGADEQGAPPPLWEKLAKRLPRRLRKELAPILEQANVLMESERREREQAENPTEIQIGTATTDITPPIGSLLVGYAPRRSKQIGHPLRAEALVCRQGDRGWALITSDVLGYPAAYVGEVRARISRQTGLPPEAVMISGTHTHSGPASSFGALHVNELDLAYLDDLKDLLAAVVGQAWRAAVPARFEAAWTQAGELISNRRVQKADGTWTNEWDDPQGTHTGFADPAVLLVGARPTGSDQLSGLLVNFGCHPVTLGGASLDTSADYPGYLKDRLEADLPGCAAMFALAGGANIDPRVCCTVGAEHPRRLGETLAATVLTAVPSLSPLESGPLGYAIAPWEMIRTKDAPGALGARVEKRGDLVRTEVHALRAGGLLVLGVPGELFSEFNARFRQIRPDLVTLVVSMADDYVGYLPTDEAQAQGAYEPTWAPIERLEQALMDRATEAIAAATAAPPG